MRLPAKHAEVSSDVTAPYYLRFIVADEPGIVAAIAGVLARKHINIDSILQHRGHEAEMLPFVVTTEPCSSVTLEKAIEEMRAMSFLLEAPLAMQILVVDDKDTD